MIAVKTARENQIKSKANSERIETVCQYPQCCDKIIDRSDFGKGGILTHSWRAQPSAQVSVGAGDSWLHGHQTVRKQGEMGQRASASFLPFNSCDVFVVHVQGGAFLLR